jgi:transcriptional regulator with XRE-family HTH domain
MSIDVAQNLKLLCSREKSISEVCRTIGINRQQFSKYLSGASQPSAYNLNQICDHFSIRPADLFLPTDEFATRMEFRSGRAGKNTVPASNQLLRRAFPGDRKGLARYLGYYVTHCHSFSWSGYILRAVSRIYERDGLIYSKTIERTLDPGEGTLFLSKYDGQVSLMGNRIFVVEYQGLADDAIVETVLFPSSRSQLTLLRGVTFGLSSKQRKPYVSRCVWKYVGSNIDIKTALKSAGLHRIDSAHVDPKVMRILGERPFPNELLHHEFEPHQ